MLQLKNRNELERMFSVYCKKVLNNLLIDYMRTQSKKRENEISIFDFNIENTLAVEDDYLVEEIKFEGEVIQIKEDILYEALSKLSEQHFKIIIYYYFLDKTDKEISEILKTPNTTIFDRRHAALNKLKKAILESNYE